MHAGPSVLGQAKFFVGTRLVVLINTIDPGTDTPLVSDFTLLRQRFLVIDTGLHGSAEIYHDYIAQNTGVYLLLVVLDLNPSVLASKVSTIR